MRTLELSGWQKGTSWDKATLNSGEIKPIALAVIELCLSEGIRLSVSHIVSQQKNLLNKKFLKFQSKLIQRFRVKLKTFLGLAMPNQCFNAVRE